ncbi:NUDIX hydrolase [Bernardetia sp.]|uniref:NUDIX hydrolase n=1 Tax=Bernardetia sp. TaxID=1937974 RepID=UPI0025C166AB|nr:NUDIX hydrolase [Bernardetia sp.]
MDKQDILKLLENYQPIFSEEKKFQKEIIDFIEQNDDFALRSNLTGQLTGSAWVVNSERTKVLLIHHKKLNRWLQIGGHIETDDQTIEQTILREVTEESGLKNLKLLSSSIYDLDVHTIPQKKEVAEHLHFDIRLVVEADENDTLLAQNEEVLDVKWYFVSEMENPSETDILIDASMKRMINKMKNI